MVRDVRSSFGDSDTFVAGSVWTTPSAESRRSGPEVDGPLQLAWNDAADQAWLRSVSVDVVGPGPGALQAERAPAGAVPDPVEPLALG